MKKFSILASLAVLLTSCSGYILSGNQEEGSTADTLALVGEGTLSLEDYNDVSPFVFKAPGGKKFLFFASDRPLPGQTNQNFNIWVSLMVGDKFTTPRALSNVNTASNETQPVVFSQNGQVYLSVVGGVSQQVETWQLGFSNDQFLNPVYQSAIPSSQGYNLILLERNNVPVLLTTWGSNLGAEFLFQGTTWKPVRARYFAIPVGQGHGFHSTVGMGLGNTEWYLFERNNGTHWQITMAYQGSGDFTGNNLSGFFPVMAYQSLDAFNDRTPFIDTDDARVYFASDRYKFLRNPHYDLYRYNEKTFGQQIGDGGFEYYPLPAGVYVSPSGSLAASGLSPSAPLPSLPAAVNLARSQGLSNIYVAAGIYSPGSGLDDSTNSPGLVLTGSPLRLLGGFDSTFVRRSGFSTLDAMGQRLVLLVTNMTGLYFDGFRIFRGYQEFGYGAGLYMDSVTNGLFINTQITRNTNGEGGGAGVYVYNCKNVTLDCLIKNNVCTNDFGTGGGLYLGYGQDTLMIFGHVINNTSGDAGGIYMDDTAGIILSTIISNNNAFYGVTGGVFNNGGTLDGGDSLITNNTPQDFGAGA